MTINRLEPGLYRAGELHRPAVLDALRRGMRRVGATLRLWRKRRRDRRELAEFAQLDDRMLRDIGLTRNDATFLINKPFWRK